MAEHNPPTPADSTRVPVIPLPVELYNGEQPCRRFSIRWDRLVPTKENEPEAQSPQPVLRTRQD
jgi:hypothetical protein